MSVKILFFGMLAEKVGQAEIEMEASNTDVLNTAVLTAYPSIEDMSYNVAVNATLVKSNTELNDGDEVAYLPPFAGG